MWRTTLVTLTAGVLLVAAPAARAADPTQPFPDRFMLRGGYGYVFDADTTFSFNGESGLGGTVDFAGTLGGDTEDEVWRIDALFRFNPRHSLGFSYYDVSREGHRTLSRDITIEDVTFAAGARVDSELDMRLFRLFYNYSFYRSEKVELAASIGLYGVDVKAAFAGDLTCTGAPVCGPSATLAARRTAEEFVAPLPTLGVQVNYNILPRLQAQFRFDWFYLEVEDVQGDMIEIYVGAEYRLFRHFAFGAAFNRLDVGVDYKPQDRSGFSLENSWNTVFVYGAFYF